MKASIVAASALVASAAAFEHKNHAGFHMRRAAYEPASEEICTVYTTVYVHALPSIVPNTTAIYEPSTPAAETSTSYTEEEESSSIYTPIVISTKAPEPSQPAYPTVPSVPEVSKPAVPEVSKPAVPESSQPAAETSTSCTEDEESSSIYTPIVISTKAPEPSTPAAETSTSCTEDEESSSIYTPILISTKAPEPSQPAYPTVPSVPEVSKPAVPEVSKPAVPESSQPAYPTVPAVPEVSKPAVPEVSKPAVPEVPKPVVPESSKEAPQPSKPAAPEYPTAPVDTPKPAPSSSKVVETPKPAPSSSKAVNTPKPVPSSSKTADKPKPTGSYSSGGRIVTNGDRWAMTYTPYAPDGNCKTEADIKADIKQIADLGFTTIRSYSTDCGVFEYVIPACQEHGLKIIYGIFLEGGGSGGKGPFSEYANNQLDDIKNGAPKDSVAMVIVGNECMFNNNCVPGELASYIDHVRETLQGAGFPKDIAITTTEPVGTWEEKGAELCAHIDVFTVQVHPYFTSTISPDMAGDFAAQQLEQAAKVCPEAAAKGKYISEIGWPSAGNSNGIAVAGVAEQKEAMKKIVEKVGAEATLFSFKDDPWKHPGALGVEQHFGCADVLEY